MDDVERWTIDELVQRARLALAGSAQAGTYAGAPNARVREVPDQRAVRWYTSTGLVDRPFGGRGRGARYGARHLRQLVAVKLLQAQGLPLAEIQGLLAGVSDDDLSRLAPLPPAPPAAPRVDVARAADRRFWAQAVPPVHPKPPPPEGSPPAVESLAGVRLAPGVLLVLPLSPAADDLAALADAARPLLAALAERGLIPFSASPAEPTEGAPR